MLSLLTAGGGFDRAAIMRKAWRDFRGVRAAGPGDRFADRAAYPGPVLRR